MLIQKRNTAPPSPPLLYSARSRIYIIYFKTHPCAHSLPAFGSTKDVLIFPPPPQPLSILDPPVSPTNCWAKTDISVGTGGEGCSWDMRLNPRIQVCPRQKAARIILPNCALQEDSFYLLGSRQTSNRFHVRPQTAYEPPSLRRKASSLSLQTVVRGEVALSQQAGISGGKRCSAGEFPKMQRGSLPPTAVQTHTTPREGCLTRPAPFITHQIKMQPRLPLLRPDMHVTPLPGQEG